MKVLIVSALGETTAAALRLTLDGLDVRYFVYAEDSKDIGRGLVLLTRNWSADVEWADLVWFDDVTQAVPGRKANYRGGEWAERLCAAGKCVVGGNAATDRLENDRMFGQKVLADAGVSTVPMHRWHGFDQAIKFVERFGGAWAIKHNAQVDRNLNMVEWEKDGVVAALRWMQENWRALAPGKPVDFVLQEAVKGVEIAMTAFFNGRQFLPDVYLNQEYKALMDGGNGPATGQMGEMGQVQPNPDCFTATLAKIAPMLAAEGYRGIIDLNCIATPSKVVPLEFTARPGYPTLWSVLEALQWKSDVDSGLCEFLCWMAGRWKLPPQFSHDFIANVVIASGTWPNVSESRNKGLMLKGVKEVGVKHVHLLDVQVPKSGEIMSAGATGLMCSVTASADDPKEAAEQAYELTKALSVVPYRLMRSDIGEKFPEDWEKLQSWNWVD